MTLPILAVPSTKPDQFFRVEVSCMHESYRKTWWVALINVKTRPKNAKVFDDTGRIFPFTTEIREHAIQEAHEWAAFLGVTYNGVVLGETDEDKIEASLQVRALMAYESGYTSSGTIWSATDKASYDKDKAAGYPTRRVLILP
jgi:hypothetical protein